jgi:hypothetical protein
MAKISFKYAQIACTISVLALAAFVSGTYVEYEEPQNCGGQAFIDLAQDKSEVVISSHKNTGTTNYLPNKNCKWIIQASGTNKIQFEIDSWGGIEPPHNGACMYDFLEISEQVQGSPPGSPPYWMHVGKYCGNTAPTFPGQNTKYVSGTNKVRIKFKSDSVSQYKGFRGKISMIAARAFFKPLADWQGDYSAPGTYVEAKWTVGGVDSSVMKSLCFRMTPTGGNSQSYQDTCVGMTTASSNSLWYHVPNWSVTGTAYAFLGDPNTWAPMEGISESFNIVARQPPGAAGKPAVVGAVGTSKVSLEWTKPTNNGGATVTSYKIDMQQLTSDGVSAPTLLYVSSKCSYATEIDLTNQDTLNECQTKCEEKAGCSFFTYGKGTKAKQCKWQKVNMGWVADGCSGATTHDADVDFYSTGWEPKVEYTVLGGCQYNYDSCTAEAPTNYTVDGLQEDTKYRFKILGRNKLGVGTSSNISEVVQTIAFPCNNANFPVKAQVKIKTKAYGNEVWWGLEDIANSESANGYGGVRKPKNANGCTGSAEYCLNPGDQYQNNAEYLKTICLKGGEFTFHARDTYGDGWHGGTYEVSVFMPLLSEWVRVLGPSEVSGKRRNDEKFQVSSKMLYMKEPGNQNALGEGNPGIFNDWIPFTVYQSGSFNITLGKSTDAMTVDVFLYKGTCAVDYDFTSQSGGAGGKIKASWVLGTQTEASITLQIPNDLPPGQDYRLKVVEPDVTVWSGGTKATGEPYPASMAASNRFGVGQALTKGPPFFLLRDSGQRPWLSRSDGGAWGTVKAGEGPTGTKPSYQFRLRAPPTAAVTVQVDGGRNDQGTGRIKLPDVIIRQTINGAQVQNNKFTFTVANYNQYQTVEVVAADDRDYEPESYCVRPASALSNAPTKECHTIVHTPSSSDTVDGGYNSEAGAAAVAIEISDNDSPDVTLAIASIKEDNNAMFGFGAGASNRRQLHELRMASAILSQVHNHGFQTRMLNKHERRALEVAANAAPSRRRMNSEWNDPNYPPAGGGGMNSEWSDPNYPPGGGGANSEWDPPTCDLPGGLSWCAAASCTQWGDPAGICEANGACTCSPGFKYECNIGTCTPDQNFDAASQCSNAFCSGTQELTISDTSAITVLSDGSDRKPACNYQANSVCRWNIVAPKNHIIELKFVEDFAVEPDATCSFDSVAVYEMPDTNTLAMGDALHDTSLGKLGLCGFELPRNALYAPGNGMVVQFNSDGVTEYSGWKAQVKIYKTKASEDDIKFLYSLKALSVTVQEGKSASQYGLQVTTKPSAAVTISILATPQNTTAEQSLPTLKIEPALLTFTTDNWNKTRRVEVSIVADNISHTNTDFNLVHESTSSDKYYQQVSGNAFISRESTVAFVQTMDDDSADISILTTKGTTSRFYQVTENSYIDYFIRLSSEPVYNVTIKVEERKKSPLLRMIALGKWNWIITPQNWDKAIQHRIRVYALDDKAQSDISYTLDHTLYSNDTNYDGQVFQSSSITVQVINTDVAVEKVVKLDVSMKGFTTKAGATDANGNALALFGKDEKVKYLQGIAREAGFTVNENVHNSEVSLRNLGVELASVCASDDAVCQNGGSTSSSDTGAGNGRRLNSDTPALVVSTNMKATDDAQATQMVEKAENLQNNPALLAQSINLGISASDLTVAAVVKETGPAAVRTPVINANMEHPYNRVWLEWDQSDSTAIRFAYQWTQTKKALSNIASKRLSTNWTIIDGFATSYIELGTQYGIANVAAPKGKAGKNNRLFVNITNGMPYGSNVYVRIAGIDISKKQGVWSEWSDATYVQCPYGAHCGRNGELKDVTALFGHWRVPWGRTPHLTFVKCRVLDACLGAPNPEFAHLYAKSYDENGDKITPLTNPALQSNETEGCLIGKTGPLCDICSEGWTKSGTNCKQCKDINVGIPVEAVVSMFVIIGFAACAYMIRATIKAKGEPKKPEVIMVKIITTHLQICAMASAFPLAWPSVIRSMFKAMLVVSSVNGEVMSIDCLLAQNGGKGGTKFYAQAIMWLLVPIIIVAGCTLFWGSIWAMRKVRLVLCSALGIWDEEKVADKTRKMHAARLFDRWVVSLVVLLFLFHPTLTKVATQLWTCSTEEMEGRHFLEMDFSEECYKGRWFAYALGVGVTIFGAYVVGIPAAALGMLYKKHEHLMSLDAQARDVPLEDYKMYPHDERMRMEIIDPTARDRAFICRKKDREMFGFLYSGYEDDFYYWEFVIMIRKICFAVISVALKPYGVDIQTYCGILVLIGAYVSHAVNRPFLSDDLDDLENGALVTSFLTLYGGLYLFSENTSSGVKMLVTFFLVFINCGFVVFVLTTVLRMQAQNMLDAAKEKEEPLKGWRMQFARFFQSKRHRAASITGTAMAVAAEEHMTAERLHNLAKNATGSTKYMLEAAALEAEEIEMTILAASRTSHEDVVI